MMKIKIEEHPSIEDIEIIIKCREKNSELENVVRNLKLLDLTIIGFIEARKYIINTIDIYYFESVEEKIFCYTRDEVYETKYRLYELESLLQSTPFVRVSRTMILNISKIKSFKSILSGRIECLLKNKEKVYISRTYVKDLKKKLGIKRGEKK